MRKIKLVTVDGKTIYEGLHDCLKEAVEFAITQNIQMDRVNLADAILHHINLDSIRLQGASFKGADLRGANMSEAHFTNCDFSESDMTDACLCYSNINSCNFRYSTLEATDLSMASLDFCEFEGFGTFNLNFDSAYHLSKLIYHHFGRTHEFNASPIFVKSGEKHIVFINNYMICKDIPEGINIGDVRKMPLKNVIN